MSDREQIEALRREVAELRERLARVETGQAVTHHHHHYPPQPQPLLSSDWRWKQSQGNV